MLRERAVEEATTLFHTHGAGAVGMMPDGLISADKDAEGRRHDRLVIVELERLDRVRRNGASSATALVVWKPPLLSLARFRAFWRKRRPRRR